MLRTLLMPLLVLIMGFPALIGGCSQRKDFKRLEATPIEVISEPVEEYTEHTERMRVRRLVSFRVKVRHFVNVRYRASDGYYSCSAEVGQEIIDRLKASSNSVLRIRYASTDHAVCDVVGGLPRDNGFFLIGVGLILIIGSSAYIYNVISVHRDVI